MRGLALALVVLLTGPLSGATAAGPPEILYREGPTEDTATGPWLPLDGAHVASLGLVLGSRQLPKPPTDSAVYYWTTIDQVPDGHPDPKFGIGVCSSHAQSPGTEIVLSELPFEGPGTYRLSMSALTQSEGATSSSCTGGPVSTATFTIDPTVTMSLTQSGSVFLGGNAFSKIATVGDVPAGGAGESACARDATIRPDGSVAGSDVVDDLAFEVLKKQIPRAGQWTCVGRARSTYSGPAYTRWS